MTGYLGTLTVINAFIWTAVMMITALDSSPLVDTLHSATWGIIVIYTDITIWKILSEL